MLALLSFFALPLIISSNTVIHCLVSSPLLSLDLFWGSGDFWRHFSAFVMKFEVKQHDETLLSVWKSLVRVFCPQIWSWLYFLGHALYHFDLFNLIWLHWVSVLQGESSYCSASIIRPNYKRVLNIKAFEIVSFLKMPLKFCYTTILLLVLNFRCGKRQISGKR